MMYIVRLFIEARIDKLITKRDEALQKKDYDRAWKLNMKIDNNINKLIRCSYYEIWV